MKPNPEEIRRLRKQALLAATVTTPGHDYGALQNYARKHGLDTPGLPFGGWISGHSGGNGAKSKKRVA